MASEKQYYYQCKLRKDSFEQVAWIEKRGAMEGVSVELLPSKELWKVIEVYDQVPYMEEKDLKEMQIQHRGSLPSVEPIK